MRLLNRFSISQKLTLFGVATSFSVVSLMALALAIYDIRNIRMSLERSYSTMADVIGQSCAEAIERRDQSGAERVLKVLEEDRSFIAAQLLTTTGDIFVEYRPKTSVNGHGLYREVKSSVDTFTIRRPIAFQNEAIGDIELEVESDAFWSQSREHMLLFLGVTAASVLIAILLASFLQKRVSAPIFHLVKTARAISETADYSRRAHRETNDELGQLCDEFNGMLGQIESRDAELDLHRRHLEDLVRLRTEALEQKTREALAASVAKSQFLANMSHEIRTPMNAILGFADLLQRGADHDDKLLRDEYLNTISTSGRHLLTVINDVLDLSKIEAGKLQVECIPCSPHKVISEAVTVLRANAMNKGLFLEYDWDGPCPPEIQTDPSRLRQLLINLLGNAIKFTEDGGVRIVAGLSPTNREQLQIQVIDTGIGIPADKLREIFDPFAQADASVTRRFGGTGLGLAISQHIAQALGGGISVTSQLGHGSTFTVAIETGPLDQSTFLDAPIDDAVGRAQVEPSTYLFAPGRILLVEDGSTNRKLIRIMLQRYGLEVVEAVNGLLGVELARDQDFDVIFMDMQMPVMDGYTATANLRAMGMTTPIIALTAHAMAGDARKCHDAGCTDYLTKPIDEVRLMETLAKHLKGTVEILETGAEELESEPQLSSPASTLAAPETAGPIVSALPQDDAEFCEIIAEFVQRARDEFCVLKTAAQSGDWNLVTDRAHWLKGSGGTAGFAPLTIPSGALEKAARNGDSSACQTLIAQLEALLARLHSPAAPTAGV
jgi:signal transduction histidine kinase/CheY-like chemotaxis protein/HPt (histidine-containing phosphotransfer) domain-containing protein